MKKKYLQNPDTGNLDVTLLQDAIDVPFDGVAAGLLSNEVQNAIGEVNTKVESVITTVNAATPNATPDTIASRNADGGTAFKSLNVECNGIYTANTFSMTAKDIEQIYGGFGQFIKSVSACQTTSATPVSIFSGTLPNAFPMMVYLSLVVTGKNSDNTKRAVIKKDFVLYSDGVNVSVDQIQDTYTYRTDPTYDYTPNVSGLNINVDVTGDAAENMNWIATFEEAILG